MEFVLMKLVGQSIRPGSIFGILDKDNPGQLPPAPGGYWSDHGAMTEENFPFAAEAKQAIAKSGYFLVGTDAIERIGHAAPRGGTVKANKYRRFSVSNPAERVGDS
jgi:hypothetical protein